MSSELDFKDQDAVRQEQEQIHGWPICPLCGEPVTDGYDHHKLCMDREKYLANR